MRRAGRSGWENPEPEPGLGGGLRRAQGEAARPAGSWSSRSWQAGRRAQSRAKLQTPALADMTLVLHHEALAPLPASLLSAPRQVLTSLSFSKSVCFPSPGPPAPMWKWSPPSHLILWAL